MAKEYDKTRPLRLGSTEHEELATKVAGLVAQGWTVAREWDVDESHYVELNPPSKKQD